MRVMIDSWSSLVVLYIKTDRIFGHSLFHSEKEGQPSFIFTRLSPCNYVSTMVDWSQVGGWRTRYVAFVLLFYSLQVRYVLSFC